MKTFVTILNTIAIALSGALAQTNTETSRTQKSSREAFFKKLDANGDGVVTRDEFMASPEFQKNPLSTGDYFNKLDTNGDGELTLDEFTARAASTSPGDYPKKQPESIPKSSTVRRPENYNGRYYYLPPTRTQAQKQPTTGSTTAAKPTTSLTPTHIRTVEVPAASSKAAKNIKPAPSGKATSLQKTPGPASLTTTKKGTKSKGKNAPGTAPASS